MKIVVLMLLIGFLAGCAGANISSQARDSGIEGSSMMTRCETLSTRSSGRLNSVLEEYDGWKLIYVSEYTTANKTATAAVMCFEKPILK